MLQHAYSICSCLNGLGGQAALRGVPAIARGRCNMPSAKPGKGTIDSLQVMIQSEEMNQLPHAQPDSRGLKGYHQGIKVHC